MEPIQIHLLVNHIPVLGTGFGFLLLLGGLIFKSDDIKKAAFGLLIIAAITTPITYWSGGNAEDAAEELPGVTHAIIEAHEHAAEPAAIATYITGLLALIALISSFKSKKVPGWGAPLVLILCLVSGGLMIRAAKLGGEIRHTEIRANDANEAVDTDYEDEAKDDDQGHIDE